MAMFQSSSNRSPFGSILGLVVVLVVLYILFKIVGWFVNLLYIFAPLLFIASLIVDHTVFLGYVKTIRKLFERNWVMGVAAIVLSLLLYPLVSVYLLGVALFKKKVREARRDVDERRRGEWTEYEELPEEPLDLDTTYEELPPPPPPRREEGYDEYFK